MSDTGMGPNMSRGRVLLVDDDERLRQMVAEYLQRHGLECLQAGSATAAEQRLAHESVDLVVLDLMLPDEYGINLCRRLRDNAPDLPILILSARGDDVDRIIGLEVGADDYLPKPCNLRELVARIFSILRRSARAGGEADSRRKRFGGFEVDLWTRTLRRGDETVKITTGEYQLLEALVTNARRVLSRDELISLASGRKRVSLSRSVDILISRLRQVLEDDPASPRYIQTVWGRGYMFVPDPPQ